MNIYKLFRTTFYRVFLMRHISLVNDIKHLRSPNAVNVRGRKLCPITFDILTCNNTIHIDGVLYSIKGFSQWIRSELDKDYDRLCGLCKLSELFKEKSFFIKFMHIRSPMTNTLYDISTLTVIYDVFILQYYVAPIHCVYDFITKYIDDYRNP
uniref:Uncharacterized protein n=1 Tax=viral metagenome TaxID=1070528 RepID=A0A6C0JXG0_9ZZZZ